MPHQPYQLHQPRQPYQPEAGREALAASAQDAAAVAAAETITMDALASIISDAKAVAEAVLDAGAAAAAVTAAGDGAKAGRIAEVALAVQHVADAASSLVLHANGTAAEDGRHVRESDAGERGEAAGVADVPAQTMTDSRDDIWGAGVEPAPAHLEWASFLADPVLPRFASTGALDTVVSAASPGEQGLWRDISLVSRARAALQDDEAQFKAAFRDAPCAMLVAELGAGRAARFVTVNPALSELTGYPLSELLDLGFADLASPTRRALPKEPAWALPAGRSSGSAGDETVEQVVPWVHADGRNLWVRLRTTALRTYTGATDQVVCQVEDVTDRLRSDEATRGSEARLQAAFDASPAPSVLVELGGSRPGRLVAANRAACALFGRSEVEMPMLSLSALTLKSAADDMLELLERLAWPDSSAQEVGEFGYRTAAGELGRLSLTTSPVSGPGQPTHALVSFRDTTPVQETPGCAAAPSDRATIDAGLPLLFHGTMAGSSAGADPVLPIPTLLPPVATTEETPLRVLLADDDSITSTIARLMLTKLGHHVDLAANGVQAVQAVEALWQSTGTTYDVVLMDIEMPVLNGLDATRQIRSELPDEQQPRIVAITGGGPLGDRDSCLDAGMDSFLPKPLREVDLRCAVSASGT